MKTYWVAQTTTPNFQLLKESGFVVFYPAMEDYVFLEVKPENAKWFGRVKDLGIKFQSTLGKQNEFMTITESELDLMKTEVLGLYFAGAKVKVVGGVHDNMTGEVLEELADKCRVRLQGFNRQYEVWIDKISLEAAE